MPKIRANYLKNPKTGRVVDANEHLLKRTDLVLCTVDGDPILPKPKPEPEPKKTRGKGKAAAAAVTDEE